MQQRVHDGIFVVQSAQAVAHAGRREQLSAYVAAGPPRSQLLCGVNLRVGGSQGAARQAAGSPGMEVGEQVKE